MRIVIVELRATEGRELAVSDFLQAHAARSKMNEPDCIDFQIAVDTERPEAFLAIETYTDADAHMAHRETAHFQRFLDECFPMLQDADDGSKFFTRRILERIA